MGNEGSDTLYGGAGDDTLADAAKEDTLRLGAGIAKDALSAAFVGDDYALKMGGNDLLKGGKGKDVFVFDAALGADNVDTITDFGKGRDRIQLSGSIFTALSAASRARLTSKRPAPAQRRGGFVVPSFRAKRGPSRHWLEIEIPRADPLGMTAEKPSPFSPTGQIISPHMRIFPF